MRFLKEKKGQSAIEVLLMIGGAIIIVTLIGLYLKRKAISAGEQGTSDLNNVLEKI